MKRYTLTTIGGAAAVLLTVLLATSLTAQGDPPAPVLTFQPLPEPPAAPAATEPLVGLQDLQPDISSYALAAYVRGVMESWPRAVSALPAADYGEVAGTIAEVVVLDGGQWPPAWRAPEARVVLLAGLAYYEGARFASYVDEQRCDDPAWRSSAEGRRMMLGWGDCDGGRAVSLWQVHPVFDTVSPLYPLCNPDVVADRVRLGAARCALEIARRSLASTGDLSGYTGEGQWTGAPKAKLRLDFVQRALAKHPWSLPKE